MRGLLALLLVVLSAGSSAAQTLPAWMQGQAVGEWRQIPGTALSSRPPSVSVPGNTGPRSKVDAWTSFVLDPTTSIVYSPANGGHLDYSGNEVNALRLSADAPSWVELRPPTPSGQIVSNATHYADGRPASRHSYYGVFFDQGRNRVMIVGGSRWGNGGNLSTMDGFNPVTNDWDPALSYPSAPSGTFSSFGPATVWDPAGDLYIFSRNSVRRWRSATNTWTTPSSNGVWGVEAAAALDTKRNRILVLGGSNNEHHIYTPGASSLQSITLGGAQASAVAGNKNALVYEPALDAFLLRKSAGGGAVYRIDPATFAVTLLATTGGASIPATQNGPFNKFLYVPRLGGVVYMPTYAGSAWFFRTAGEGTEVPSPPTQPTPAPSPPSATAPEAPTQVAATALSSSSVGVTWSASSGGDGYGVERCQGASCTNFVRIAVMYAPTTSHTDTGLAAGTTYRYRVLAGTLAGTVSGYSPIATVTTPSSGGATTPSSGGATTPSGGGATTPTPSGLQAPAQVTATALSASSASVTWSASNGADGYGVERCQGASCTDFVRIATTSAPTTSHTDSGLAASTTYRYRLQAGALPRTVSGYSVIVNVTTPSGDVAPPPAPGPSPGTGGGPIPVGELAHDGPSTPEQISLLLPVTGNLPQTATATVRYRRGGDAMWLPGHPLYRIRPTLSTSPAVGSVPDAFAWPISDLEPGTTYDVEVTVTSGTSSVTRTLTHTTRALPPAAGSATKTIPAGSSSAAIQTALNGLVAGDVLEFQPGTYNVNGLQLNRSGTAAQPIYVRGAARDGVVLVSPSRVLQLLAANHVVIENLTMRGSGTDSGTSASSVGIAFWDGAPSQTQVTVRNVTITGVDRGIIASKGVTQLLVYDNVLVGNNTWTEALLNTNATWNDDGIRAPGVGNAVFNNTLTGFGDTLSYAAHSGGVTLTQAVGVHFYRNDIRNSGDDLAEIDHAHRNVTLYDNRSHNSMTFVSLDPLYGGPLVVARNIAINVGRSPFKWNSANSGQFIYNNTVLRTTGRDWVNSPGTANEAGWIQHNNGAQRAYGYRNNLLVYRGASSQTLRLDNSGHDPVDFTHNAWFPAGTFKWPQGTFSSLNAARSGLAATTPVFGGSTRRHDEDVLTVSNPWTTEVALGPDYRTQVTASYTPVLASGTTPKNSGAVIPNITDRFSGPAPDRGAIIAGRAIPHYGARAGGAPPSSPSSTAAATFTLTVTKAGTGTGTVTASPAGISCGTACSATYSSGTSVTLTPTPAAGSVFAGWSGNCTTGVVTMDAAKSCTATFSVASVAPTPTGSAVTITIGRVGTGSGTVTSDPAGITCGAACSASFAQGSSVRLIAAPATGSRFIGWSGDVDCTDGTVTADAAKRCIATFDPAPASTPTTSPQVSAGRVIEITPSTLDGFCSGGGSNVTLQPGDEVVLRGGTYSQQCRRLITGVHGTATSPIVIRAAAGEKPVLTRPMSPTFDFDQNNLEIQNSSYLIIRGLTFIGGDIGVRFLGTNHHITLEDNEVADTGNVGIALNSGNSDAMIIRRNHIHHTGRNTARATEGEGIYLGCHDGSCRATNSVIEGNYIHHLRGSSSGGNDGIEVKPGSGGNVIRDNIIHDTTIGTRYPCIFVYGGGAAPNVVERNAMWNCGEAIQVAADAIIRNNIILTSDRGITAAPHAQVPAVRNVAIVNNTIYGHAECLYVRWSGSSGTMLANNAIYCPGTTAVNANGVTTSTVRSNFVEGATSGAAIDGKSWVAGGSATLAFVNPAAFDFWPSLASPLRNGADASAVPGDDFNGVTRVGPFDVGAYEADDRATNPGWPLAAGFKHMAAVDPTSATTLAGRLPPRPVSPVTITTAERGERAVLTGPPASSGTSLRTNVLTFGTTGEPHVGACTTVRLHRKSVGTGRASAPAADHGELATNITTRGTLVMFVEWVPPL